MATTLSMCLLVSQTEPAEAMFALFAGHVHATRVLLDQSFAFRAWLGVHLEPKLGSVLLFLVDFLILDLLAP